MKNLKLKLKLFPLVFSIAFFVFFVTGSNIHSAVATWDNSSGDGLWSTCANWTGGTGTGGCPGTGDIATFNGTSNTPVSVDTSVSVAGINIATGYTSTITQATLVTITVGANGWTQSTGTFTGGDSAITLNHSSGSFSLTGGIFSNTSNILSIYKDMTVNGGTFNNTGTVKFNGEGFSYTQTLTCSGTIPGTVDVAQANYPSSTFVNSANCIITLATNVTTIGSIVNGGTMNATNITTNMDFTQNGTLNLTGTLTFGDNGTSQSSVLTCSGTIPGTVDIVKDYNDANDFTLSSNCIITLATNVTTIGSIVNGGTMNATNITVHSSFTQNGTLNLSGTLTFGDNGTSQSSVLTCSGTIPGTVDIVKDYTRTNDFTLSSNCEITLATNVTTIGDFTNGGTINGTNLTVHSSFAQNGTFTLSGTLTLGDNGTSQDTTLTCTNPISANVVLLKDYISSNDLIIGSNCTITGSFTRTDGNVSNPASAYTLTVQGDLSISTTDTFGGANLTLNMAPTTGTKTITQNAGTMSGPFKVTTSGGATAQLATNFTTGSTCNVVEGIFDINGKTFACGSTYTVEDGGTFELFGNETTTAPTLNSGSTVKYTGDGDSLVDAYTLKDYTYHHLTVASADATDTYATPNATEDVLGTFTLSAGVFTAASGNFTVSGNFAHSAGTFTHNSGTVVFNDSAQTSTISGTTTFNNVNSTTAGKTLTFTAGSTQTVNGLLTITGTSGDGNKVTINSSSGSQWYINHQGTEAVTYASITNSGCDGSSTVITLDATSTDGGGNGACWSFPASGNRVKLQRGTTIQRGTTVRGN